MFSTNSSFISKICSWNLFVCCVIKTQNDLHIHTHKSYVVNRYIDLTSSLSNRRLLIPVNPAPPGGALTVSHGGQAQVLHAVLDQLVQLLALRPPVQVEPLLWDAIGPAGRLGGLPAEPPRPLHALLPQQRVLRLVAGGGVPVGLLLLPGLPSLALLLALLHVDGHLGLGRQGGGVTAC